MIKILLVYENYNHLVSIETSLKKIGFDVLGITNEYSLSEKVLGFNPDLIIASGEDTGKVKTQSIGEKLREMTRWLGKVILVYSETQDPSPEELIKVRADQVLVAPVEVPTLITTIAMLSGLEARVLLERLAKYTQGGSVDSNVNYTENLTGKYESKDENIFVSGKNRQESEPETSSVEAPAFSEVNFSDLMQELQGTVPSSSGIEVQPTPLSPPSLDLDQEIDSLKLVSELHDVEETIEKRMDSYKKYINPEIVKGKPQLMTRMDAIRAHKEMSKDWDRKKIEDIDTERRRYTNSLFEKPKK